MRAAKGKAGLTTTMWVLLVVFGLLVIVGVVLWMMTSGKPNYNPSQLREPRKQSELHPESVRIISSACLI